MDIKLACKFFLSEAKEDVYLLMALINTDEDVFEWLWISNYIVFTEEWQNRSHRNYTTFLHLISEKFNIIFEDVGRLDSRIYRI